MLNLEIKIKLLQQRHKTEDETVMRLFYIVAIGCHIMLSMLCLRLVVMNCVDCENCNVCYTYAMIAMI